MKKNTVKSLTKMQRKVRTRRKKWTQAERFENRKKNAERLLLVRGNPLIKKLLDEAEQEVAHEHEHGEHCDHDHEEHPKFED